MGLKMSFAVLQTTQPGAAFAAGSDHDPKAAEQAARMLLPDCEPVGTATLADAMYSDRLMIGAYGASMMIGDPRLFEAAPNEVPPVVDQIAGLMPTAVSRAVHGPRHRRWQNRARRTEYRVGSEHASTW